MSINPSNNLTVNNHYLLPRKSINGRLERSSFQTQRLSDVGVAFGQQITANMGLKLPASQERIVEQTRWLYRRYVFVKLSQHSLSLRDLNLTKTSRARRAAALGEVPQITCSAPATAGTEYCLATIDTPEKSPRPDADRVGGRRRTAMSGYIDSRDMSLLAAKMQAINLKNESLKTIKSGARVEKCSARESRFSHSFIHKSSTSSDGSAASGIGSSNPASVNSSSNAAGSRKYIMDPTINNQIFTVILKIIGELRDLKPEFYGDTIYELIGIDKFSSIESLLEVQMTICQEMIRSEISWCRVAALFSLFGAMSLDCVRLGTPEHVGPILDGFIEFVERDLALWISQQGGWESFLYKHRAGARYGSLTYKVMTLATAPLVVWLLLTIFRWQ